MSGASQSSVPTSRGTDARRDRWPRRWSLCRASARSGRTCSHGSNCARPATCSSSFPRDYQDLIRPPRDRRPGGRHAADDPRRGRPRSTPRAAASARAASACWCPTGRTICGRCGSISRSCATSFATGSTCCCRPSRGCAAGGGRCPIRASPGSTARTDQPECEAAAALFAHRGPVAVPDAADGRGRGRAVRPGAGGGVSRRAAGRATT